MRVSKLSCCVFLLLCPLALTAKHAPRFPSPNLCHSDQPLGNRVGTWLSKDCPITALCIPPKGSTNHSRCACDFTEEMFIEDTETGTCKPSTATYIFAGYWSSMCFVTLILLILMAKSIIHAKLTKNLRLDPLTYSILACFLACFFHFTTRALRVFLLVGMFTPAQYESWLKIQVTLTAIYSLLIIGTVLTFGIAVHFIVVSSSNLRAVNAKLLNRRVAFISLIMGILIVCGSGILLNYSQYALAFAYSALFCLLAWLVYFRIMVRTQVMKETTTVSNKNNNSSKQLQGRTRTRSMRAGSVMSSATIFSSSSLAVNNIFLLSSRIFTLLVLYLGIAIYYNVVWFFGRNQQNANLLSYGIAVGVGAQYILTLAGIRFVHLFALVMFDLRSGAKQSPPHFHSSMMNQQPSISRSSRAISAEGVPDASSINTSRVVEDSLSMLLKSPHDSDTIDREKFYLYAQKQIEQQTLPQLPQLAQVNTKDSMAVFQSGDGTLALLQSPDVGMDEPPTAHTRADTELDMI